MGVSNTSPITTTGNPWPMKIGTTAPLKRRNTTGTPLKPPLYRKDHKVVINKFSIAYIFIQPFLEMRKEPYKTTPDHPFGSNKGN